MPEYNLTFEIPPDVDRFIRVGRMDYYAKKIGELLTQMLLEDIQIEAERDLAQMEVHIDQAS